tara:strand:- start:29 stop:142 length:114 start_codon:yes stop_codon:yes gene_type:complete
MILKKYHLIPISAGVEFISGRDKKNQMGFSFNSDISS